MSDNTFPSLTSPQPATGMMNVTILLSMPIASPLNIRCLILPFGAVQIHSFDPFYLVHTTCFDRLALRQSANLLAARPPYCYNNHKRSHISGFSTMSNRSGGKESENQYATHFTRTDTTIAQSLHHFIAPNTTERRRIQRHRLVHLVLMGYLHADIWGDEKYHSCSGIYQCHSQYCLCQ